MSVLALLFIDCCYCTCCVGPDFSVVLLAPPLDIVHYPQRDPGRPHVLPCAQAGGLALSACGAYGWGGLGEPCPGNLFSWPFFVVCFGAMWDGLLRGGVHLPPLNADLRPFFLFPAKSGGEPIVVSFLPCAVLL